MGEHDFFSFSFSFFFPFFFLFPPENFRRVVTLPFVISLEKHPPSIIPRFLPNTVFFRTSRSLFLEISISFRPEKTEKSRVAFLGKKNPKKEYAENLVPNFSIRTMKLTLNLIWTNFESDRFNEAKTVRIRAGGV